MHRRCIPSPPPIHSHSTDQITSIISISIPFCYVNSYISLMSTTHINPYDQPTSLSMSTHTCIDMLFMSYLTIQSNLVWLLTLQLNQTLNMQCTLHMHMHLQQVLKLLKTVEANQEDIRVASLIIVYWFSLLCPLVLNCSSLVVCVR